MTASMMTGDVLGICLLVSGGDLSMNMEDVIILACMAENTA
jgi:hypothetical protein